MIPAYLTRPTPAEAYIASEARGRAVVRWVDEGTSDPDHVMRELLRMLADLGHVVPPSDALRGFCRALQKRLEEGATG